MKTTTAITTVKRDVQLQEWAEQIKAQQVSGKNKLVDAVRYTLNKKKYLYTFLEDGDVPIDNNRAENAIRPSCSQIRPVRSFYCGIIDKVYPRKIGEGILYLM